MCRHSTYLLVSCCHTNHIHAFSARDVTAAVFHAKANVIATVPNTDHGNFLAISAFIPFHFYVAATRWLEFRFSCRDAVEQLEFPLFSLIRKLYQISVFLSQHCSLEEGLSSVALRKREIGVVYVHKLSKDITYAIWNLNHFRLNAPRYSMYVPLSAAVIHAIQ